VHLSGFPLSHNFYVRVRARKFYWHKLNRGKVKKVWSLNVKLSEVQLLFTRDLSSIASILFANVNFTHVST